MTNQSQNNQENRQNPSFVNYPSDAFVQNSQQFNNQSPLANLFNSDNNILPLLMSMLGKNGDISKVFSQSSPSEETKKENISPKDELLL